MAGVVGEVAAEEVGCAKDRANRHGTQFHSGAVVGAELVLGVLTSSVSPLGMK